MNYFDATIMSFVNSFAQHSFIFDRITAAFARLELLKGGLFMALIWGIWFAKDTEYNTRKNRTILLATITGAYLALVISLVLQLILPFTSRPLANLSIDFKIPFGFTTQLDAWSAFPSDTTAFFCALATGMGLYSLRMLYFAIPYTFFFILFPRVYLGLHYPSDMIAGALLGIGCVLVTNKFFMKTSFGNAVLDRADKNPGIFYPLFFIVTYQMAVLFVDLRQIASGLKRLIRILLGF